MAWPLISRSTTARGQDRQSIEIFRVGFGEQSNYKITRGLCVHVCFMNRQSSALLFSLSPVSTPALPALPNAPWFHDFCSWKRARAGRNLTLVLVFRGGEKAKKNRRNEPRTYTGPRTEPAPAVLGASLWALACGKLGKETMMLHADEF